MAWAQAPRLDVEMHRTCRAPWAHGGPLGPRLFGPRHQGLGVRTQALWAQGHWAQAHWAQDPWDTPPSGTLAFPLAASLDFHLSASSSVDSLPPSSGRSSHCAGRRVVDVQVAACWVAVSWRLVATWAFGPRGSGPSGPRPLGAWAPAVTASTVYRLKRNIS